MASKLLQSCVFFLLGASAIAGQQRDDARRFLRGRIPSSNLTGALSARGGGADALLRAQQQRAALPALTSLTTAWSPLGPAQVLTAAYGKVTGRITSIAFDPADATGNTIYLGTTGGGVWKSTNALAAAASVIFTPLMDQLPAFSANAASSVIPSLSIGAVSVQPGGGVLLAGTGDPNDASDSYYGEGLLRSTDGGLNWTLVQQSNDTARHHSFTGEGFAGFAWSTTLPNLVVAAVSQAADGTFVSASTLGTSARGLYYSTDAGATWSMATLMDGTQAVQTQATSFSTYEGNAATDVVWSAARNRFYAAVRFHGYYESVDGITWTRLAKQPGAGLTTTNCPANVGRTGSANCPIFRGALSVQPVTGDLFAFTVDTGNGDQGIWQDVCALSGNTCANTTPQWAKQWSSTALETSGKIVQGDYNLVLSAVPSSGDTLLFAGTTEVFRCSLATGCSFRNTTNATTGCAAPARVAPAQHAMAWRGTAIFFGNDGGLWRSNDLVAQEGPACGADDPNHFENLNGALGSLAEVNSLASHPSDANVMLAGLGTLGSAATTAASSQSVWTQLGIGESGTVAIDQGDPRNWFVQSGGGVAVKGCSNGTACTAADFAGVAPVGLTQVSGDASLIDAPFLLDPVLNTNAIVATCRVWRGPTVGGTSWSDTNAISPAMAGTLTNGACGLSNTYLRALAAGGPAVLTSATQTSGSPILYAGMAGALDGGGATGGHLYRTLSASTANSSTAWTDVSASSVSNDTALNFRFNPAGYDISSIYVDPHDASGKTVYVTIMGFGVPHLYRSTDAGDNWLNVSRNLPDAPANAVTVDPNDASIVYLATDVGVFATTSIASCATADCWASLGTGLPNSPVVTLDAKGALKDGVLRVGTYGRGVWEIPLLTAGAVLQPVVTFAPSSLTFDATPANTTGTAMTLTATNSGNAVFQATAVDTTGDFSATSHCIGANVSRGATCQVSVSFSPTATGARTGTLRLYGNVNGGYISAALNGTGTTAASLLLTPANVSFFDTLLRSTSAVSVVTVNNSGTSTVAMNAPSVSGDFAIASTTCGATLNAGASCTVNVTFTPTATGVRTGRLSLTDAEGIHSAQLSGRGIAAGVTLSVTTLSFADTQINTSSVAQTVTLTNTGTAALSVASVATTGDFDVSSDCVTASPIAVNASCSLAIKFAPTVLGARTGTLTLTSNRGNDSASIDTISLNGNGVSGFIVSLLPAALSFPDTTINTASAQQIITVNNTGTAAGTLGSITVSGDYSISANTCGTTLAASSACSVAIKFNPTTTGTRSGVLSVMAGTDTKTATLTGKGVSVATDTLSPASLSFAGTTVGTASAAQNVTLTNTGDVALTLVAAKILSGDFAVVNACGTVAAAHSACALQVTFTPTRVGAQTGVLEVTDVLGSQTVMLNGSGVAGPGVTLSPATLTFGDTGVGNASAAQTITLSNNGGSPLTVTGVSVSGDFGIVSGANLCSAGTSIAAGAGCTVQVAFTPSAAGARAGTLTIAAGGLTKTSALSGKGVNFTLTASGTTSATIANGRSAVFPMLVTPEVAMSNTVSFACNGVPKNAKCTVSPASVDLTLTSAVNVTVLTGTSASVVRPASLLGIAATFPLLLWLRRRRFVAAIVLIFSLGAIGCGAGRQLPADYDSGSSSGGGGTVVTPGGSYPIVVSATSAGLTRSVTFTLVVQ